MPEPKKLNAPQRMIHPAAVAYAVERVGLASDLTMRTVLVTVMVVTEAVTIQISARLWIRRLINPARFPA